MEHMSDDSQAPLPAWAWGMDRCPECGYWTAPFYGATVNGQPIPIGLVCRACDWHMTAIRECACYA
jgi:hypothetical protein